VEAVCNCGRQLQRGAFCLSRLVAVSWHAFCCEGDWKWRWRENKSWYRVPFSMGLGPSNLNEAKVESQQPDRATGHPENPTMKEAAVNSASPQAPVNNSSNVIILLGASVCTFAFKKHGSSLKVPCQFFPVGNCWKCNTVLCKMQQ